MSTRINRIKNRYKIFLKDVKEVLIKLVKLTDHLQIIIAWFIEMLLLCSAAHFIFVALFGDREDTLMNYGLATICLAIAWLLDAFVKYRDKDYSTPKRGGE